MPIAVRIMFWLPFVVVAVLVGLAVSWWVALAWVVTSALVIVAALAVRRRRRLGARGAPEGHS
jgi:uncharacterized membrane protein YoaK (UPF0700 family)